MGWLLVDHRAVAWRALAVDHQYDAPVQHAELLRLEAGHDLVDLERIVDEAQAEPRVRPEHDLGEAVRQVVRGALGLLLRLLGLAVGAATSRHRVARRARVLQHPHHLAGRELS